MNNRNSLKIAMLGHKHIPSREGGIEIVVEELSTRMVKLGHEVTCFNRKVHHVSGREFDGQKLKSYKGIKLLDVFTIDGKGLAAMTSSVSATIKAAIGIYDVVHFHGEGSACMCWLPKLFGKRIIVTIHGIDWKRAKWGRFASMYIKQGEKSAIKYADEIIVLSKGAQQYFMNTYDRKTVFISNGVSKPQVRDAKLIKERYALEKNDYILFLGRIVPEKGLRYLINAYEKVKTNKKLVIAGGSSDTDIFMKEIRGMAKTDNRIIFTGFVQGEMLDELYSNAYIYILPSDLEGMPLSLLEAMSYGNCCLVSNISECIDVVENKAVIFDKSNVHDLRIKLQMLCDQPKLVQQYQMITAEYVFLKYDWDKVVEETLNLY